MRTAWALGWAGLAAVVVLSLAPLPGAAAPPGSDKLGHMLAWLALAGWWSLLLRRRPWATALALLALGALLETLQAMLPWRQFEPADLVANLAGVLAGAALARGRGRKLFARFFEDRADR